MTTNMITKIYANVTVNFHCTENDLKSTCLIYLLKFPNNKYYVGQTTTRFGLISRIQGHCYEAFKERKKRNDYKDAIVRKYRTFDVFILHKCKIVDIDDFEIFYIDILRKKLVNIESGGCANKCPSQETRQKISKVVREYNRKHPKEIKINVYDLKGNFIRSHNSINEVVEFYKTNRVHVVNSLYKIRKFMGKYQIFKEGEENIVDFTIVKYRKQTSSVAGKRYNTVNGIRYLIDKFYKYNEDGTYVDELEVFGLDLKIVNKIKAAIKRHGFYDGFLWSFEKKEKIEPQKKQYEKISDLYSRPIYQLDDDLNIIKKWKNATIASAYYKVNGENIRQTCIRWRRHCGGYVWCYQDEYEWYKSMWKEKLVRKR